MHTNTCVHVEMVQTLCSCVRLHSFKLFLKLPRCQAYYQLNSALDLIPSATTITSKGNLDNRPFVVYLFFPPFTVYALYRITNNFILNNEYG